MAASRAAAWQLRVRLTSLLADWTELNGGDAQALAGALLRACEPLSDEALRALPATPEDAAVAITNHADGSLLPFEWLESFCAAQRLPIAELDNGWDISDGEDVYFCPRVDLADDPDSPDDKRPYVRVDQITRWPEPSTR